VLEHHSIYFYITIIILVFKINDRRYKYAYIIFYYIIKVPSRGMYGYNSNDVTATDGRPVEILRTKIDLTKSVLQRILLFYNPQFKPIYAFTCAPNFYPSFEDPHRPPPISSLAFRLKTLSCNDYGGKSFHHYVHAN